jgi:hypothetical protein
MPNAGSSNLIHCKLVCTWICGAIGEKIQIGCDYQDWKAGTKFSHCDGWWHGKHFVIYNFTKEKR